MDKALEKNAILVQIEAEHTLLQATIARLTPGQMQEPGVNGEWAAKDILAHLSAWEQLFIGWYRAGLKGENPHTPVDGLTWKSSDLNLLNERIFQAHRAETLTDVLTTFESSYREIMSLVQEIPEDDMHTPKRYAWMRAGKLAGFVRANTYNHYKWANTLIKKRYPRPK